jgi:hydrophobe/amphiphile efflux-1 (HAE1) family protein
VRSVLLIIRRQPGANIIETNERVKKLLPEIMKSIPAGIREEVALDRTQTIRASVEDVEFTLVLSVFLVVIVVFMFLRSVRATIIPSIAVPLSLVATFGVMYLLNYSLDNLSLMALTISTGFVVDDAIVVTENIERYIQLGHTPHEAALMGAKQIGFTIVSITVSLLAVFIPILLMGGIVGRLFREFAVTLSIAIAVSAVVSLTLTPMMCSVLLKRDHGDHGRAYKATEAVFDGSIRLYDRALTWVLNHSRPMLALTLGTIALTGFLFVKIPKGLFPQQDTGLLMGVSEAPQDVSFVSMRERQVRVNKAMQTDPDVRHVVSFIGRGGTASGNTGTVFVELKPNPPRKSTADQVIARLRPKLGQLEGVKLFLQAVQDVRVGGRSARTQYQYTLQDANLEELRLWAPRLMTRLAKLKEVKDVNTDQQSEGLSLDVDIDRDTAARLGLTPQMIDDALYDAFGQRQVATNYTQLNQYRVVIEVKPEYKQTPDALNQVYVKAPGGVVPLPAVAKFSQGSTQLSVTHQGQFPCITLSFNLPDGVSLGDAVDAIHAAELDIGMPPSIHAGFQGTASAFQASLRSQPYLIGAALIAVYIVLGMLYESLIHPITILSTLPSAGVGALLALMICGTDFSIIALIGIILLIGIVKKNAIMMIDFALEVERDEGLTAREAIHRACVLRFRPIMMTTLAALFGGLPLAFGSGIGSEMRKPLGIAIVGGLIVSQMLTLFTTPVIYLSLDRFRRRSAAEIAHSRRRGIADGQPVT